MRQPHNNKQTQMKNQKTKRTKPQGEKNKAKPLRKPKNPNLREKSEAQAQAIVRACFWFPGARAALEREKKDEEDD